MKKLNYLLMGMFLALAFTSCKTGDDETPAYQPPSATEFAEIRQNFLDALTQTQTFDATEGLAFTSPKGVNVNIYGLSATGNVQLRYIELFDIGTMALANRPLMGKDYFTEKVLPLVTGGEFFIEVTQNGTKLDGNANLQVPVEYTIGADPAEMSIWTSDEESTVWVEGGGEMALPGGVDQPGGSGATSYYYCWLPFSWTNIDWLYSLPGEQTQLRVKVPNGYDDTNASIYAAFLTQPNTLASLDVYDKEVKYFTEHTGIAPIGYQMFLIFISGDPKGKQFVYATKLVTVEANQYVTFTDADLHTGSAQQIIDAINGLYK
ncbi:MAG: hypothetical protein LBT25_07820 [Candidatus Symbiothrix sp.]|jgi:hypothetical protein|nr:hypothetical protein [Candidatus Symbiothrix sp.]